MLGQLGSIWKQSVKNAKPNIISKEQLTKIIQAHFGKLSTPILNILNEILAPLDATFKQEVENEQPYLKGNPVFDDLIQAGVEEKKEKLLATFSELLLLSNNKEGIKKQVQAALEENTSPTINHINIPRMQEGSFTNGLRAILNKLVNAAKATFETTKIEAPQSIQVGINISYTRGIHFSEFDFPLLKPAKYATMSSADIYLDFGDRIYILPEMFMHYIDDVESIGWSWVLPKDFLECLKRGYQKSQEKFEHHHIGYLTTKQHDSNVFESGSPAGQKQNLIKVATAKSVVLESSLLALLQHINTYIRAHRESLPGSSQETNLVSFNIKEDVKKIRPIS